MSISNHAITVQSVGRGLQRDVWRALELWLYAAVVSADVESDAGTVVKLPLLQLLAAPDVAAAGEANVLYLLL